MGNLQIPIVQIPRKAPLSIDERLEASEVLTNDSARTMLRHIQVTGEIAAIHTDFLFQGTITGTFSGSCDRCVEAAEIDESIEVSWLFELGKVLDAMEDFAQSDEAEEDEIEHSDTEENADQIRYYEGDEIALAPHAREEMILASPTKIYCAATCKGLCPQCGANLNHNECDCTEKEIEQSNSGFNALRDMYPDLPSNTSEE